MFIYFILLHIYSNSNKKKKKKAHKSARITKYNVFLFFFSLFLSLYLSYTYWDYDVLVDGTSNVNITEIRTEIFDNLLTQLPLRLSNQYRELILFSFVPPFPLISPAFQMFQQTVL